MAVNIGPKIGIDGEAEYRKEIQNIIQQTKTLSSEMNETAAAFKDEADQEKASAEITKKLNEQMEAQRKLVEKLEDAVKRSTDKTGESSTETLKWKEQLAKAKTELHNMEQQAGDAAKGVGELGAEEEKAGKQTSVFGDMLKANLASDLIRAGLAATTTIVKDLASGMIEAVKNTAAYADEILTLSKTTGMGTDAIQEWKYAADLIDVSFETIEGSLNKLTKNMDSARDGAAKQAQAFEALGVEVTDANGNLRDNSEVFMDVISALRQIEDPTERDAAAMDVLGKSAKELNPLIETSEQDLKNLRKEAHEVGAVMEKDTLDAMSDVQDSFDRMSGTWEGLKRALGAKIGIAILPELEKLLNLLQNLAKNGDVSEFVEGVTDAINGLVKKIPEFTKKIISEQPKVIKSVARQLPKLMSGLAQTVGEVLGQSFKNLPELLKAGAILIGRLIEGIVMFIPNLIDGIVHGFKNDEIDAAQRDLVEKYQGIRDAIGEIVTPTEKVGENMAEFIAKQKEAEHWAGIFEEIGKKTNPTAADLNVMNDAAEKLNEIFPELGLKIDEETGKWNLSTEAIRDNIKALELRARAEAYGEAAQETLQEIAKLDVDRDKYARDKRALEAQKKAAEDTLAEMQAAYKVLTDAQTAMNKDIYNPELNAAFYKAIEEYAGRTVTHYDDAKAIIDELGSSIESQQGAIVLYGTEIDELGKTITAADTKLAELNADAETFFRKQTAIEARAETYGKKIVGMLGDGAEKEAPVLNNRMQKLIADTVNTLEGDVQEETSKVEKSGKLIGVALLKGASKGIDAEKAQFIKDAGASITAAIERMKMVAQIHSPSKVTEDLIGRNLALGVIKGYDEAMSAAATRQIFSLTPVFDEMTSGNTVTNNSTTMNLGGMSFTINAAQGQSVDAIANAVMRKIQSAVDSRKAVFA
jgi:chromosome segregation ATPase